MILKVLQYPDPRLKRVGKTVVDFNDEIKAVVKSMFETHYSLDRCAALAATQLDLDIAWHITVIDFSDERNTPLCLINAKITDTSGIQDEIEGCMSVYPGECHAAVKRAAQITVKAQDVDGKFFEMNAEGFMAKCIQHELDHLNGIIYLDRISRLKKDRIVKKIKTIERIQKES